MQLKKLEISKRREITFLKFYSYLKRNDCWAEWYAYTSRMDRAKEVLEELPGWSSVCEVVDSAFRNKPLV